jgi:hypothetical protein
MDNQTKLIVVLLFIIVIMYLLYNRKEDKGGRSSGKSSSGKSSSGKSSSGKSSSGKSTTTSIVVKPVPKPVPKPAPKPVRPTVVKTLSVLLSNGKEHKCKNSIAIGKKCDVTCDCKDGLCVKNKFGQYVCYRKLSKKEKQAAMKKKRLEAEKKKKAEAEKKKKAEAEKKKKAAELAKKHKCTYKIANDKACSYSCDCKSGLCKKVGKKYICVKKPSMFY